MAVIFVVSFAPASDSHGVGGFDWSREEAEALASFEQMVSESREDGGHIVRLIEVETDIEDNDEVTDWLDAEYLGELEIELHPVKQYIPEGADEDRLPNFKENIL